MAAIWQAHAARATGRLGDAERALEAPLALARRQAYEDAHLSALVLREAADIAERRGLHDRARKAYDTAVTIALPGLRAAPAMVQRAALARRACEEGHTSRVVLATEALAGVARTGDLAAADLARVLLTVARPFLDSDASARSALWVELSAARAGDAVSAARALEAARATGSAAGAALALLHGARALRARGDHKAAFAELRRAASAARRAPAGAVRCGVEAAVAMAHLDGEAGADPARVEIHLRRVAEAVCAGATSVGAGELDPLLPPDDGGAIERAVRRLLDCGRVALARRLCSAGRRRALAPPPRDVPGMTGETLRRLHRGRFRARYDRGEANGDAIEFWQQVLGEVDRGDWPSRGRPGDATLEFRVFGEWTVGFAEGPGGSLQLEWPLGRDELETRVARLRSALRTGEDSETLHRSLSGLHDLLLTPFTRVLEGASKLFIAADGPLLALPFAALHDEQTWLAERHDVALLRPADPPRFDAGADGAPARALIVGDAATSRDLQISRLAGPEGFAEVAVRHGPDLGRDALATTLERARVVHLVGALDDGPVLELSDDAPATPFSSLADALAMGGAVCATLMGPTEGVAGRAAVAALLPGLRGGLLTRGWAVEDDAVLLDFLAGAAHATQATELVGALGRARREAIRSGAPPSVWAAFELHLAVS